jgi:hypothetical protein
VSEAPAHRFCQLVAISNAICYLHHRCWATPLPGRAALAVLRSHPIAMRPPTSLFVPRLFFLLLFQAFLSKWSSKTPKSLWKKVHVENNLQTPCRFFPHLLLRFWTFLCMKYLPKKSHKISHKKTPTRLRGRFFFF